MIHGMRSAFYNPSKRQGRLVERGMHTYKIVVASANKAARISWAVLTHKTPLQPAAA
jgi:hypothetical protein